MERHHTSSPRELPQQWRETAHLLREHGAPDHARLVEHLAAQLDGALAAGGDEALTLVEAAKESGYSPDYLGGLVRKGKIPNAGRSNAPRIRRSQLPTKKSSKPGRPPTPRQRRDEIADARALKKMKLGGNQS